MIDPYGRQISYLRLSVTDRCDLRCFYCMAEDMTFRPQSEVLSLEELGRLAEAFISLGVRKIRLTGGEPLVRRNIMELIERLGEHVAAGQLKELTLTTNGTQLAQHAKALHAAGIRRVNVSLDSLNPTTFRYITRRGDLGTVLDGIAAAKGAGLHVKINTVALRGINDSEFDHLISWCGSNGFDLTLIETMPMGEVEFGRTDHYLPLHRVQERLERKWTLAPTMHGTDGPARYLHVAEAGIRLGLITPMTHNFCDSCNRIRLTSTGALYTCLGQEEHIDLRTPLRQTESSETLSAEIAVAVRRKPKGHNFAIGAGLGLPTLVRHMSVTGG